MPSVTDDNPSEGWDRVAARLEKEIQQRGLSRARLARESGVSPPTITKLLAGEPVARADRLAALAHYLGWPGDAFDQIRSGEDPHGPIQMAASGVDMEALRTEDPEAYAAVQEMARVALDRARQRGRT